MTVQRSPIFQTKLPRRPMYDLVYEAAGFRIEVRYDNGSLSIDGATDTARKALQGATDQEVLLAVLEELQREEDSLEAQLNIAQAAKGLCTQLFADFAAVPPGEDHDE